MKGICEGTRGQFYILEENRSPESDSVCLNQAVVSLTRLFSLSNTIFSFAVFHVPFSLQSSSAKTVGFSGSKSGVVLAGRFCLWSILQYHFTNLLPHASLF